MTENIDDKKHCCMYSNVKNIEYRTQNIDISDISINDTTKDMGLPNAQQAKVFHLSPPHRGVWGGMT